MLIDLAFYCSLLFLLLSVARTLAKSGRHQENGPVAVQPEADGQEGPVVGEYDGRQQVWPRFALEIGQEPRPRSLREMHFSHSMEDIVWDEVDK